MRSACLSYNITIIERGYYIIINRLHGVRITHMTSYVFYNNIYNIRVLYVMQCSNNRRGARSQIRHWAFRCTPCVTLECGRRVVWTACDLCAQRILSLHSTRIARTGRAINIKHIILLFPSNYPWAVLNVLKTVKTSKSTNELTSATIQTWRSARAPDKTGKFTSVKNQISSSTSREQIGYVWFLIKKLKLRRVKMFNYGAYFRLTDYYYISHRTRETSV